MLTGSVKVRPCEILPPADRPNLHCQLRQAAELTQPVEGCNRDYGRVSGTVVTPKADAEVLRSSQRVTSRQYTAGWAPQQCPLHGTPCNVDTELRRLSI